MQSDLYMLIRAALHSRGIMEWAADKPFREVLEKPEFIMAVMDAVKADTGDGNVSQAEEVAAEEAGRN